MATTQPQQQAPSGQVSAAPSLPDVNAETYPFDFVQHLLDQTANLNLFAVPELNDPGRLSLTTDSTDWFGINGGYGCVIRSTLHRFDSFVQTPSTDELAVSQAVGEAIGSLRARWLFSTGEPP